MFPYNFSPQIESQLGPEFFGVLWMSHQSLSDRPHPFYAFDYLLDGLLTQYAQESEKLDDSNKCSFFVTKNFSGPFFIAHFYEQSPQVEKKMSEILELVDGIKQPKNQIAMIGFNNSSLEKKIDRKYSQFKFHKVNLPEQ